MSYSTITLKIEEQHGPHQRIPKKFSMSMEEADKYLDDDICQNCQDSGDSYYMGRTLVDYHKVITQKIAEIVYKDFWEMNEDTVPHSEMENVFTDSIQIEDPRLIFDIRSNHYFLQYVIQVRNEDNRYEIQSIYVVSSIRLTPTDKGLPHIELRLFQEDCN